MIKAIVYQSNTGFAQRYAQMLSQALNVTCLDLDSAAKALGKGEAVLFMGSLLAGNINGYKKARKRYDVRAVAAVGLTPPSPQYAEALKAQNKIAAPFFYLHGGMDINKLKGIKKKALMMVVNQRQKMHENETGSGNQSAPATYVNFISDENLGPIIEWYRT